MDILLYKVQKMGCFGTLICPRNKAGKCIFWPSRNPKTKNFPTGSKHGKVSGRYYMKQIIHQSEVENCQSFLGGAPISICHFFCLPVCPLCTISQEPHII